MIALVSPFPASDLGRLWNWLHEYPEANTDDYGPVSFEEFSIEMRRRMESGERTWGVLSDGALCGAIGFAPATERLGWFHGICFSQSVHGRGIARQAVARVLDELFASGIEKVCAGYFADNARIDRLFKRLGAVEEGLLRAQTLRNGKPVDMRLIAIFRGNPLCHSLQ